MNNVRDFKLIQRDVGHIEDCPVCGSDAEMYDLEMEDESFEKVVCCSREGDQESGILGELMDCPMFSGLTELQRATIGQAREAWNKTAIALRKLQGR